LQGIAIVEPVQFQSTANTPLSCVFKFSVLCRNSSRSVWGWLWSCAQGIHILYHVTTHWSTRHTSSKWSPLSLAEAVVECLPPLDDRVD